MSLDRNKYRKISSQYSACEVSGKAYNTIFFSVHPNGGAESVALLI